MIVFDADIFSRSVAARRAVNRLTQQELASKAGVSINTIRRIERKETNPSIDVCCDIANSLGCSLEDLLRLPQ